MLQLAIVTATPSLAHEAVRLALSAAEEAVEVLLFENGCRVADVDARHHHEPTNIGVTAGLQRLHLMSDPDPNSVLVYMHDDVEVYERGWDRRIARRFAETPRAGIVGFGGAMTLSRSIDRGPFYSNMKTAERHGRRRTRDFRCATVDGFGFAVRRSFMDQIGGWSWWPLPHHGYDNGLSCMARRHRWETWACPISCHHIEYGTSSQPVYRDQVAARHGGDGSLYHQALRTLQERFADVLPLGV